MYRKLRPHVIAAQQLDEQTILQNEEIRLNNGRLLSEQEQLQNQNSILFHQNEKLTVQNESAVTRLNDLKNSISQAEKQAQEAADLFYKSKLESAKEKLNTLLEKENQKHQENVANFQIQYDIMVSDAMKSYEELSQNVAIMRATNDAAVAAAKRAEEMKDQLAFYRIQLTDADIQEIEMLRKVEPYLRDKEPLNKVIWKCYYEKPTTDMIGRVIGSGVHTGIYKITEISTGKCYVGQAANLSDRWKQHIKRGVGAEAPTRNKLYPAMIVAGPENFTFEIIEECDRGLLDERELFWQDYFKAREFGFSIK